MLYCHIFHCCSQGFVVISTFAAVVDSCRFVVIGTLFCKLAFVMLLTVVTLLSLYSVAIATFVLLLLLHLLCCCSYVLQ